MENGKQNQSNRAILIENKSNALLKKYDNSLKQNARIIVSKEQDTIVTA